MARSREDIVTRIRALLSKARGTAGTPEGDLASDIALREIRKHAVSDAELTEADRSEIEERLIPVKGWPEWKRQLLAECALHAGCADGIDVETREAFLYGHASAIDVALYLFEVFLRELTSRWEAHVTSFEEDDSDSDRFSFHWQLRPRRRPPNYIDWHTSAVQALHFRLEDHRRAGAEEDPQGAALVVQGSAVIEAWLEQRDVEIGEAKAPSTAPQFSRDGWSAGHDIPITTGIAAESDAPALGKDEDP